METLQHFLLTKHSSAGKTVLKIRLYQPFFPLSYACSRMKNINGVEQELCSSSLKAREEVNKTIT